MAVPRVSARTHPSSPEGPSAMLMLSQTTTHPHLFGGRIPLMPLTS